jgi:probable rRNA maturation factor
MTVYVADEQTRPLNLERLQCLAQYVLADQRVPPAMELSVLCVDRDVIAELNACHMDVKGPTDVLAFPIDFPGETNPDEPALLGDVVLCPEVAAEQARRGGRSLECEVELLLVHGILHLLGHDHVEPEERDRMFRLTDQLLAGFRGSGGHGSARRGVEISRGGGC